MLGTGEIIVILAVILLLFGGKKLPEFARNLGRGIKEFKRACNGLDEHLDTTPDHPNEQKAKQLDDHGQQQ